MQPIAVNDLKVKIRPALPSDMTAVLSLIKELAVFEKSPEAVIVTVDDLVKDGFGEKKFFKAFVAETNSAVVGIALTYIGYSTWKGKLLYLDDIVVREQLRSKGIGKLLFEEVIKYGAEENARVLKWQVLRWNTDAMRFYRRFDNVVFDDEWVDCKMYQSDLKKLAK